jgi:sensor c-di-GMP phosphodiesterase-like protein
MRRAHSNVIATFLIFVYHFIVPVLEKEADSTVHFINHHPSIHHEEYSSEKELWFKAAVIAVPIAGGFILVLLVLLAVRMLRQDSKRHHRLMQMRNHRSLTKAQLYVTDHFYIDKNEKCSHLKGISNSVAEKNEIVKEKHKENPVLTFAKLPDKKAKDGSNGCSYTRDSVLIWGGTKPETIIKDSSIV